MNKKELERDRFVSGAVVIKSKGDNLEKLIESIKKKKKKKKVKK